MSNPSTGAIRAEGASESSLVAQDRDGRPTTQDSDGRAERLLHSRRAFKLGVAWRYTLWLLLLPLLITGCGLLRVRPSSPKAEIGSLVVGTNLDERANVLEVLENQVTRFADSYAAMVAQAVDDYTVGNISPPARIEAVRWKLGQATAAFVDASGANPALNALDLVVLATVSRMVMEDEVSRVFGTNGLPLLAVQRQLETNAWTGVSRVLKPHQIQQLHGIIEDWRRQHPNQRYVAATRFRELAVAVGQTPQPSTSPPSSIFSLLFLDPLAGLDPTAAAIQETRQLAERAMYYSQRMPMLLNWQVQLLSLQLVNQPETKQILSDTERLTRSTEAFARVADQMPKLVNDQRQAGIQQILDGLASERTNLLAGLASQEQSTRALLAETRQTLDAGRDMAVSVQAATKSLDEFVRSVSPGTNSAPAATNSKPFNVLDYGQAAGQIGGMAQDLNGLLTGVNQSAPELARLRGEATADAERVLNHAFWLGLALSLIVLAGAVLAGLAYRGLADKWKQNGAGTSPSSPVPGTAGK